MGTFRLSRRGGVIVPPGFGAPAGIVYPGSADFSHTGVAAQTTHMVLNQVVNGVTVPQLDAGWTVLYKQKPAAQQNGYSMGPFHSKYGTDWNGDVSLLHYAGLGYPYPREPGATVANAFEISMGGGDQYVWDGIGGFSDIPAYGVAYNTAAFVRAISGWLSARVFPRWVSASDKGPSLLYEIDLASRSHPTAAQRAWTWGDAIWNRGNERYNGNLQQPSLFTGEDNSVLSDTEVDIAFEDPLHPSVASRCFHCNPAMESMADISDKSGNNHHPTLVVGGSAPALSRAEF